MADYEFYPFGLTNTILTDLNGRELATMMATPPVSTHGAPVTGTADGASDWRFVVEALVPDEDNAIVGVAVVGTDAVASSRNAEWADITQYVAGVEWERGAFEFGAQAETGVARVTIQSDAHQFAAWNQTASSWRGFGALFGPGFIIRIGLISPTLLALGTRYTEQRLSTSDNYVYGHRGWVPKFTGLVEDWPEETVGVDAYASATVTLVETTAVLARINDLALGSAQDGGLYYHALPELLDYSDWQYGAFLYEPISFDITSPAFPGTTFSSIQAQLQTTTYALNRLVELRTAAVSLIGVHVYSDPTGAIMIASNQAAELASNLTQNNESRPRILDQFFASGVTLDDTPSPAAGSVSVIADRTVVATNSDALINHFVWAPTGSTATTVEDSTSVARYGRFSSRRTDLLMADTWVDARLAAELELRSNLVTRIDTLALDFRLTNAFAAMTCVDFGDVVTVRHQPRNSTALVSGTGFVRGLFHQVRLGVHGVVEWQAELGLDSYDTTTEVPT